MKTLLLFAAILFTPLLLLRAEETNAAPSTEPAPSSEAAAPSVIQATDAAGLEAKVGTEVIVGGIVKDVGKTSGGGLNFINFGDRKTGFTAIVSRSALEKFPEGLDKYANHKVRVRGNLEKFQDRQIQIKVSGPDQLEIVASAP